jgi:hypothetical protein
MNLTKLQPTEMLIFVLIRIIMINNTASYFIHIGDLQIDCSVIASNLSIGLSDAVSKKQATFIFDPKISFQKINELSVAYIGTIENASTV